MRIGRHALLAGAAALLMHGVLVQLLLALDEPPRWRDDPPPRLQALYVRTIAPQPRPLPPAPPLPAPAPAAGPPAMRWLAVPALPGSVPPAAAPAAGPQGMLALAPDDGRGSRGAVGDEGREDDEDDEDDAGGPDAQGAHDGTGGKGDDGGRDGHEGKAGLVGRIRAGDDGGVGDEAVEAVGPQAAGSDRDPEIDPAGTTAGAHTGVEDRFDWPPSTRLRYALVGHWRGPLEGRAQVEWLRAGDRYQVHLDIVIGAPFAPLITRQMSSDGRLGADGLRPERYDERTRVLWRTPLVQTVRVEGPQVRLANGRMVSRPPGLQDAVSQFVQLAWQFTREPWRLVPGQVVTLPLALPRRVGLWHYDVRDVETIDTPAGPVEALRLEPRVRAHGGADLIPEVWYAPALQYLPVRILVRHDDESFVDMTIDRLPEQAAPAAPPTRLE